MKKIVPKLLALILLLYANSVSAGIIVAGAGASVKTCVSDTTTFEVSGGTATVLNCTFYDTGIAIDESATVTNCIGYNSLGDDITIAVGKTVTGTYNLFQDAGASGAGTYSDGSSTSIWSADPLFISATNFALQGGSPARNTAVNTPISGTANVTDFALRARTNADGTIIADGGVVDIGAYEYGNDNPIIQTDIVQDGFITKDLVKDSFIKKSR